MIKFIAGIVVAATASALAALATIYSGVYDVAATKPHSAVATWLLDTTLQHSVRARAGDIKAPAQFADADIKQGLSSYNAMCIYCHGAPGREPSEIGKGLQPPAPDLADAARRWSRGDLFWIVKHGVRMTGMPAFAPTHNDEQLWKVVAFVEKLPGMSAEQYQKMVEEADAKPGQGYHQH